ncbi:MAG: hypothetical protein ABS75_14335 [Pelagibacterium sp. SCN 63-23]|nr:MAG: hypothetical protein ABS75_14335 [Pelagibacterium sp. SCN 63-23]
MPANSFRLSTQAQAAKASEIRELLKLVARPSMISFAGGIPDPTLLSVDLFHEAWREIFSGPSSAREALQYSTTEGYGPLRQWIADYMANKGVRLSADHVLITAGSQQALDLIGRLMLDRGDRVLTARPSYLGALQSFGAHGARFATHGAPHAVAEPAPKLLYLIPDFANPDGRTMSRAERVAALDRARALDTIIVEDAAYTELRYDGESLPPIAALDQEASGDIENTRTLYCGTFSKTLSPGLRVGWVCGPTALVRKLALLKQGTDLHTATFNQRAIHHAALAGFDVAVERARATYRTRRDAMLAALARYAPPGLDWSRPQGGMFIWLTLPVEVDANALLERAIGQDIAFVPGGAFFADGGGRNTIRLSFSQSDEAQIEVGIYKLCALIANAAASPSRNVG